MRAAHPPHEPAPPPQRKHSGTDILAGPLPQAPPAVHVPRPVAQAVSVVHARTGLEQSTCPV